jgi:hypothetical protein
MTQDQRDWWESGEEEWDWISGGEERSKNLSKLKTYAVQFKADKMRSVEVDGFSEKDAIVQVIEEYSELSSDKHTVTIISVIEVDYD